MKRLLFGLLCLILIVTFLPVTPVGAAALSVTSYGFSPNPITLGRV